MIADTQDNERKIIAVAGGTGGLGRHIVDELLHQNKHDVVILTRSKPEVKVEHPHQTYRTINYTSPESIRTALQNVHTLICTQWAWGDELSNIQLALIDGAIAAGVKRFVPSEWAGDNDRNTVIEAYAPKKFVVERLKQSGLEWTVFMNGIFMNYLASPHPNSHLRPHKFILDVENNSGIIPGTGDEPIIFTTVQDVARYVTFALDLPSNSWPRKMGIVGERTTYNQVVKIVEKINGVKFDVVYKSIEELKTDIEEKEKGELMRKFFGQVCLGIALGEMDFGETKLEGFEAVGVEGFVGEWWGKRA